MDEGEFENPLGNLEPPTKDEESDRRGGLMKIAGSKVEL